MCLKYILEKMYQILVELL